jgi:hypothetical protein
MLCFEAPLVGLWSSIPIIIIFSLIPLRLLHFEVVHVVHVSPTCGTRRGQRLLDMIDAFRQGLNQTGYLVGQNCCFRTSRRLRPVLRHGRRSGSPPSGGDLCDRRHCCGAGSQNGDFRHSNRFYMAGDPVQQGLLASLSRPGGNVTGFGWLGFALAAKRLELRCELLPNGSTTGMLLNPANPASLLTDLGSM